MPDVVTITARYPGTCPECGGRWSEGDPINAPRGRWQHEVCPDTPDDLAVRHGICQTCWLDHPEGACDR